MSFDIPQNYDEWKHCITVICGIQLTPDYVKQRIAALEDLSDDHTRQFIKSWGQEHHGRTVAWFQRASKELGST